MLPYILLTFYKSIVMANIYKKNLTCFHASFIKIPVHHLHHLKKDKLNILCSYMHVNCADHQQ